MNLYDLIYQMSFPQWVGVLILVGIFGETIEKVFIAAINAFARRK
jgi:hypothetical protein